MWSKASLFEALASPQACRLELPSLSGLTQTTWGQTQLDALRRQGEEWLGQPIPEAATASGFSALTLSAGDGC